MPDSKDLLKYILGSEEFFKFYSEYVVLDDDPSQKELIEVYLEKLEKPECYVSILGVQGAGKTSLLNALLFGDEVLPVEVEETTCIPTLIRCPREKEKVEAEVHYLDGRIEKMPLKKEFLEKIVDNRYNPGNIMKASHVVCKVNASMIKEGFVFADFPGVGSLTDSNEAATMKFLRETHIGLFMLRTVPPITDSEAGFIKVAWPMVQQSIFIQNLWAQETESEIEEGIHHNEKVLQAIAAERETNPPKNLLPINVAMASRGSYSGDKELMQESGINLLQQKIRDYANHSFLRIFYYQTGQYFHRLVLRAARQIGDRVDILKNAQEEVISKFDQEKQEYVQRKEELQRKVNAHCETFSENISTIKTDWLPEKLEEATQKALERMDQVPVEDFKEEDFRNEVSKICGESFQSVYHDLQRELGKASGDYISNLSGTLQKMASLDDIVQDGDYFKKKKKDPKASSGWGVILSGSVAPLVITGPAGWSILGGAFLAGSLVRWISGATAHKRIMRSLRKAFGDAKRQIRGELITEIDLFSQKVLETIRETVKQELTAYEQELSRISQDLQGEISERKKKQEVLEAAHKQATSILEHLEKVTL